MGYITETVPHERPTSEMTEGALKKAFAAVLESKHRRVDSISRHLFESSGLRLTVDCSDQNIDELPRLIANSGRLWDNRSLISKVSDTIENQLAPGAVLGRSPHLNLSPETVDMVFDGALLWGEVFRHRYPEATWAIGRKPKLSVDYGEPVLVGPYRYLSEFGVRRQLYGFVGTALFGNTESWTLSSIMKIRAFELGLGPDPRRRVMP